MTTTLTKKFGMSFAVAFVIGLFTMFATPVTSYASSTATSQTTTSTAQTTTSTAQTQTQSNNDNNIGGISVTVDGGNLQINGGSTGFGNAGSASAWDNLIQRYRNFIVGISGIGAVSMIAFFIVQFMKLGASAGNPQARTQALMGVLWTGLAAAGLGAVALIVGFFYHSIG